MIVYYIGEEIHLINHLKFYDSMTMNSDIKRTSFYNDRWLWTYFILKIERSDKMINVYKDVMGSYPTGVTVVTTMNERGETAGLTVNSFASVSLDPLLILWSIDKGSRSLQSFLTNKCFAINILSTEQKDDCFLFASKEENNKFNQTDWTKSEYNLPILNNSFATIQCETFNQIEAGDHYILIGKVLAVKKSEKDPLLYYKRNVQAI